MSRTQETYVGFKYYDTAFRVKMVTETDTWRKPKKARAYVWEAEEPSKYHLETMAKNIGLTHIYTTRDEYPEMDLAWDQYNRVIVKAQRIILDRALEALGLEPETITFSKYAGCSSCPCSPGFVLKGITNTEIFISRQEKI